MPETDHSMQRPRPLDAEGQPNTFPQYPEYTSPELLALHNDLIDKGRRKKLTKRDLRLARSEVSNLIDSPLIVDRQGQVDFDPFYDAGHLLFAINEAQELYPEALQRFAPRRWVRNTQDLVKNTKNFMFDYTHHPYRAGFFFFSSIGCPSIAAAVAAKGYGPLDVVEGIAGGIALSTFLTVASNVST